MWREALVQGEFTVRRPSKKERHGLLSIAQLDGPITVLIVGPDGNPSDIMLKSNCCAAGFTVASGGGKGIKYICYECGTDLPYAYPSKQSVQLSQTRPERLTAYASWLRAAGFNELDATLKAHELEDLVQIALTDL